MGFYLNPIQFVINVAKTVEYTRQEVARHGLRNLDLSYNRGYGKMKAEHLSDYEGNKEAAEEYRSEVASERNETFNKRYQPRIEEWVKDMNVEAKTAFKDRKDMSEDDLRTVVKVISDCETELLVRFKKGESVLDTGCLQETSEVVKNAMKVCRQQKVRWITLPL